MMLVRTGILHNPAVDMGAGEAVRACLAGMGDTRFVVLHESAVGHSRNWIEDVLCRWCDEEELDMVLTIGGTGPAPGPSNRELLPICTAHVAERLLPGLGEAMRAHAGEFNDLALLDGSIAAIRGRTLLLNLPAGADAAVCFLEAVVHLLGAVVAHLREDAAAPRLADALFTTGSPTDAPVGPAQEMVDTVETVPNSDRAQTDETPQIDEATQTDETATPSRSRLNPDEFAEFLRRRGRSSHVPPTTGDN